MPDAPPQTQHNQQPNDDAGTFVEVYKIASGWRIAWNVSQPPAECKLSQ